MTAQPAHDPQPDPQRDAQPDRRPDPRSGAVTTVAVLGTGTMGAGMARSLLAAGLGVRAWNRTPDKAAPLAQDGAVVCRSASEAVDGADVVVTMLFDADAVLDVMGEAGAAAGPATVWLQSATVGPAGAARVAALADQEGLSVLDAPVLGTRAPAASGSLVYLVSGPAELRERARPAIEAMSSRTVVAGDRPGQASALKLVCNAWVATLTAATAQSVALAQGLDLSPDLFMEAIEGGPTDSGYAHVKGAAMVAEDYAPSFALDGVRKDLGLIAAAARGGGVSSALLDAVSGLFDDASRAGHGASDMAAVRETFGGR